MNDPSSFQTYQITHPSGGAGSSGGGPRRGCGCLWGVALLAMAVALALFGR